MRFLRRFLARLKNFATGCQNDQRLREEMAEHLALQTEENLRVGMTPAEARRQAIFDPYHARIAEIIERRQRDQVPTLLVSLHSFTPVYAGMVRPWHIGTLYHRDTRLPPLLLKLLRAESDLVVGDNEPYDGALAGDTIDAVATKATVATPA